MRLAAERLGVTCLLCMVVACSSDDSPPADAGNDVTADASDAGFDVSLSDVPSDVVTDIDGDSDVSADITDTRADTDAGPIVPDLDTVAAIFRTSCSPCHTDQQSGGLSMRDDAGLLARLTGSSNQAAPLPRVAFGDLDGSYLWRKLEGTNVEAGGSGQTMPLSGTLSDADRSTIRAWIVDGGP